MFEQMVVSEIRGVSDDNGQSPFWDAWANTSSTSTHQADYLSVVTKSSLPTSCRFTRSTFRCCRRRRRRSSACRTTTAAVAVKNLQSEGFRFSDMVDIFDAGPIIVCERDSIRTRPPKPQAADTRDHRSRRGADEVGRVHDGDDRPRFPPCRGQVGRIQPRRHPHRPAIARRRCV